MAGEELKHATQGYARIAAVPLDKEGCLVRGSYPQ